METPVSPAPDPARPATHPPSSLQLHYATPKPRGRFDMGPDAPLLRALQQVVFAVSLGLLLYGVTSAFARTCVSSSDEIPDWSTTFETVPLSANRSAAAITIA